MTFFDETKSIIENVYFLSGSLIFFVAIIGLWQIKVAKDSLRINSQRQAATYAFELCEKFFPELSVMYDNLTSKMISLNIDFKKIEELNLHKLGELNKDNTDYTEYNKIVSSYDELEYDFFLLSEKLEIFSIPFIRKLADEELAYNHVFLKFYQYSNLCAYEIIKVRNLNPNQKAIFENVIELYSIWKNKNEKEKIQHQVKSLLSKERLLKIRKIKPIGTE